MPEQCPVCKSDISCHRINGRNEASHVKCPRCGDYIISEGVPFVILRGGEHSLRQRGNISGWLKNNPGFEINPSNVEQLLHLPTPSFNERADNLLLALDKQTTYAGEYVEEDISWISCTYSINTDELNEIVGFLKDIGRVQDSGELGSWKLKITPFGWGHLEEIKSVTLDSQQCFIAMWFDSSMDGVFEVIKNAVLDAGYKPHRVDDREHSGKIDDEIIAQIKRSRFVLADFTGHRGGVYYEAGFAKGLGLEVIWTCSEDAINDLHFDIRQYNCITWKPAELDEFKKKICNRIEATIGRGSYQSQ